MKELQIIATAAALTLTACSTTPALQKGSIRVNQEGYYPAQEKIAVVNDGTVDGFAVVDANGNEVLRGKPSYTAKTEWSDKTRTLLDFSSVTEPGEYLIIAGGDTATIRIAPDALKSLADDALRSFYYQRSGMPIEEKYAGKWNRPAGHPDDHVTLHPSAYGPRRGASTVINSSKGWYDAGDYNKYIVNSGFTVGLMMDIYQMFPGYFAAQNVNIPESGNSTPDLLDEIMYNLEWMLTMQDPDDGGVYHKLTTDSFEGFIAPTECKKPRMVVQKTVTSTLDFAASMAQASRIFADYEADYPGFSTKALKAAEAAFAWAEANPEAFYHQETLEPPVTTGAYGDWKADDEKFWAATELYLATGNDKYFEIANATQPQEFITPTWGETSGLGVMAWLLPNEAAPTSATLNPQFVEKMLSLLTAYADQNIVEADSAAFHAPYGDKATDFHWGCLSEKAGNMGIALVLASELTGNEAYRNNAYRNMNYILGLNPTGYCYVTGHGTKSPMHPHHRLSASDGIDEPIPGFLVGGPNPGQQDKNDGAEYASDLPDESYSDMEPSYASNEIAINWSASLVGLSSALDASAKKR